MPSSVTLSSPDIPVIAAIMTLHQCFIPDHFNFGVKIRGPIVIAPTDRCITDIASFVWQKGFRSHTIGYPDLKYRISILYYFHG